MRPRRSPAGDRSRPRRCRPSARRRSSIGLVDAGRQHGRGRGLPEGAGGGREEASRPGPSTRQHEARVGAELPGAQRQRGDERRADASAARRQGCRQQEHRVDAAHLGVDRDRLRPRGRDRISARPPRARAGEPDRLDARIGHQRGADPVPDPNSSENTPSGRPRARHGGLHRAADQLGRAGMGRVGLDDHRATGGQCRGGVAAGHREGQREVAGAEHRHRAERRCGAGAGRAAAAACGRAAAGSMRTSS